MYHSLYINAFLAGSNLIVFLVVGNWMNLVAMVVSTIATLWIAGKMFDYQTGYYMPYDKNAY